MDDANRLKSFQELISKYLLRHRSILDTTSKFQETNARVNRAVMKAVTECGCINIKATKQDYQADDSLDKIIELMDTHIHGHLCEHCEEIVMAEIGKNLFYLMSMMNLLDISVEDVIKKETQKLNTLGVFNMS
jgi:NTP pyrophosphatase (non-canonical NTP hydrolase)